MITDDLLAGLEAVIAGRDGTVLGGRWANGTAHNHARRAYRA